MITRILTVLVMAIASLTCFALEPGDLHLPMTRTEADNTLSKDYSFSVLTDGTIRRTWHVAKRTVSVDFDPADDSAICITIIYANPVSRKTAEADADAMAPSPDIKWKKTKPEAVGKVGIPAGSSIKEFDNKCMIFLEASSTKHKYTAVSYFSRAPHRNRKELEAVRGDQRTAMGSASMAGDVRRLISDEEIRQKTAPSPGKAGGTATASNTAAADGDTTPTLTVEPTVTVTTKTQNTSTPAAPKKETNVTQVPATTTPATTPATTSTTTVTVVRPLDNGDAEKAGTVSTGFAGFSDAEDEDKEYGNLLDVVKGKASPAQLCIAAAVVLVLLFLIVSSAAKSRAKKRQKAKFAQVILSAPTNASKVAPLSKGANTLKKH